MLHTIPTKTLQEIYDFLITRPYVEVMNLVKKIEVEAMPHKHDTQVELANNANVNESKPDEGKVEATPEVMPEGQVTQ